MVDRPKVEQMLASLSTYRRVLADLASTPRDAFLASGDKVGNAKYHFVVAIECCIDIANHLIASEGYRMPSSNADSFAVLAEKGIVPADTLERNRAMARFRNRLVHMYWDIDDEAVYTFLQSSLSDLQDFASSIAQWMVARG